jgi:hypothetical protein
MRSFGIHTLSTRILASALAGLLIGLVMGGSAVAVRFTTSPTTGASSTNAANYATGGGSIAAGAAGQGGVTTGADFGQADATAELAIYPYFCCYPAQPSPAPDHTIVVSGIGTAQVATNASAALRAAAEHSSLVAALAQADARARDVAAVAGLTLQGIVSVAVNVGPGEPIAYPMMGGAQSGGNTTPQSPPVTKPGAPITPSSMLVAVSVTVMYRIG